MEEPNIGDKAIVYSKPGLNVQRDSAIGQFLKSDGHEVVWSDWYHRRLRDGSISLYPFTVSESE